MLNLTDKGLIEDINEERLYAIKLVNPGKNKSLIVRWLAGIFILFVLSMFLPWQQNIEGTGVVTAFSPKERPQTIQTLIAGRIEKWFVAEGQFVKSGDTIIQISEIKEKYMDPLLLVRMRTQIEAKRNSIEAKKEKVKALRNQLAAIKSGLKFSLEKAENKLQQAQLYVMIDSVELIAANADNEIAKNQMERQQKLFDEGLVSLTNLEQRNLKYQQTNAKYLQALNKFSSSKNDLLNSMIEFNSLRAEYADKISKTESDIDNTLAEIFEAEATLAKQQIELSNLEVRNNYYIIRAPQDGYIVRATKQGIGETVKEGDEVCTIMPDQAHTAVEIYIKPMDLPLLYIGCPVRIQFDGWPAVVFAGWPGASIGTFGGKVQVVDYVSSSNGRYRALVVPDSTDKPWPKEIRMGSGVMAWAMLNNVMLGYEIWRQFNGFPPDFTKKYGLVKQGKKLKEENKTKSKDEEEE